ncbi:MAG TPA: alanine racemase [Candidatus Atribacteria bacterium]|nr:alanine racemase [Candidatus Atribacteria bacterium]
MAVGAYPLLEIDLSIIERNVGIILEKCASWHLHPVVVTKGFLADSPLVYLFYRSGIRSFADSNLDNLLRSKKLLPSGVRLLLIRLPMKEEVEEIVAQEIIPFVSHWEMVKALNEEAEKKGKVLPLFLALESGDAREGFLPEEIEEMGDKIGNFSHIKVEGICSTLACLSGILPDEEILKRLVAFKRGWEEKWGRKIILSVGGTTFLSLWEKEKEIRGVDEIRLGEALLFGNDISRGRSIEWLEGGAFTLKAEIVEIKSKEPDRGKKTGFDAFGEPNFSLERGKRKRMILALGKQDIDEHQLYFSDENAKIIGATSNYLVMDIEESDRVYQLGEVVQFRAGYGAVLRAFLSPYVRKVYHW